MSVLRLGTRGSMLALAQAELTEAAFGEGMPELELERVVIKTTGDKRLDLRLADLIDADGKPLDKGVFTKELELALLDDEIDVAVHSAKDVPTELPQGMVLRGALPRANVQDVLVAADGVLEGLDDLPMGARVATSSVRRAAVLCWHRPDLVMVDVRGNVQTRLRKLAESGEFEAMVLARAGLERLGMEPGSGRIVSEGREFVSAVLADEVMLCAAGQGVVSFEMRADDVRALELVEGITHGPSWAELQAERALLETLQAGCQTPISARARWSETGLSMEVWYFDESRVDAHAPRVVRGVGDDPCMLGRGLGERLLAGDLDA